MKKLIFGIFLLIIPALAYSQDEGIYDEPVENEKPAYVAKTYIGPSIGVNNISGMIGFLAEINLVKNFSLAGGVGIGGWGYKASLCGRYYQHYPKGMYYALGISTATGIKDFETELEVEPNGQKQDVKMDLNQAYNVNLSLGYQFRLGKRARFNFEVGYSVALQDEPYEIKDPNVELTSDSKKAMDIMTPGGLILGLAFTFGI